MSIRLIYLMIPALFLMLTAPACNTSKTAQGAVIGTTTGGVAGGIIGKVTGNTAAGIIIGAAVGGTAGTLIGRKMDRVAKDMERDLKGAEVERVGEGILLTFDSGLLFEFDKSSLTATTRANVNNLADILQRYPDTEIVVHGHTDSKGAEAYNLKLSKERAASVAAQLRGQGVKSSRITTKGFGETEPRASNDTEAGRQSNRRVEIAIIADENMQRAAKNGNL